MSYILLSYPKFVHKTFFVLFSYIYIYICLCFESELKNFFFFFKFNFNILLQAKYKKELRTVQMNNSWHKDGKDRAAKLDSNA